MSELKTVLDILTREKVRMICARVRVDMFMYDEKHFEENYATGIELHQAIDHEMSEIDKQWQEVLSIPPLDYLG